MINATSTKAFLSEEPSTWDAATYLTGLHLVRAMRGLGVPEDDGDLASFVLKIRRYHRAQFEEVNRAIDLSMLCD